MSTPTTVAARTFSLPDVGEGLLEAEIVTWRVAVGDTVAHNDVLVEIETAKSLVELPSPLEGTVLELLAEEGATVPVGAPIVVIGELGDPSDAAASHVSAENRPSVLVGYGPAEGRSSRRRRREPPPARPLVTPPTARPLATPPIRKLAKDMGVDLAAVPPTGKDGRVTRGDVAAFVAAGASPVVEQVHETAAPPNEVRTPVRGVRKATAAAMSASAFIAPHVTEFVTADVTRSVKLVDKLRADPAFAGHKVTMLLLVARALCVAVRDFPEINASWDGVAEEIVQYREVNLGIAAATPRGLLVPNVKDAAALSLPALARELTDLVTTARDGRTTPQDMSGGTITITNIGVFGVDAGTPILNPGEAAILCVGAVRRTPWEHRGAVALRWTTQLSLSFDHRLVDGELGSKVLARVARILENPRWELVLA
jgi:pyruvate dehydrogenase E2 component (dihydrolipoamide acetyltransferase)